MNESHAGRVALVAGAGRGIGKATAEALARTGASTAVLARTREEVDAVVESIRASGGRATGVVADVTNAEQVAAACDEVQKTCGEIDILVNNAGHCVLGRVEDQPIDVWWQQIEVSLRGTYLLSRVLVPSMVRKGWGRIVNVSSVSGKIGVLYSTAYCSAKHAVIGFTRALALEVADKGVTVNAVCPGYVPTTMSDATLEQRAQLFRLPPSIVLKGTLERIPQKQPILAAEVAAAIVGLTADSAARITGEALNVSGGQVMH